MKTIQLQKGMRLHVINSDKFKTITACMLIQRRLRREEATLNALIPNILKRGSRNYNDISRINAKMNDMYGSEFDAGIVKKGEEQFLQFYMDITNVKETGSLVIPALEFLSNIVLCPLVENGVFVEGTVRGEMENLRKMIEQRVNDKAEYAKLRCLEEMCADEAFGVYGDGYLSDLDGLTAEKLYWHYRRILQESPIDFVVIGDVNEEQLAESIMELFTVERTRLVPTIPSDAGYKERERQEIHEEMDVAQGRICMGLRSGVSAVDNRFAGLMMANEILGGGPNSRLFSNVREKESLCYYINSFIYRFKGIMIIQAGADSRQLKKIAGLAENEIGEIAKGKFTKEEFESSKRSLIKKFESIKDYPGLVMDFYISQYMAGDSRSIDEMMEMFRNVQPEDTAQAAAMLHTDTVYMLEGGVA